jgi:hypothetical protein
MNKSIKVIAGSNKRAAVLIIPQGMTGKQLVKWKAANFDALNEAKSKSEGETTEIGADNSEGDRRRPRGRKTSINFLN